MGDPLGILGLTKSLPGLGALFWGGAKFLARVGKLLAFTKELSSEDWICTPPPGFYSTPGGSTRLIVQAWLAEDDEKVNCP